MTRYERIASDLAGPGYSVCPQFLPRGECARLARRGRSLWKLGAMRAAAIGRGSSRVLRPDIRGDWICWIDPGIATRAEAQLLARIEALRVTLNRLLFVGAFDFELHWALYPPGAHYARHLDRFRGARERVVSLVLYLNEGWRARDGGALRLYLSDGAYRDVVPIEGTLVVFLADRFEHEVLPAHRERLSLTGWLRRRTG
jgi:SM-20-related protein